MRIDKSLVLLGSLLALTGCATGIALTGAGERVRHVERAEMPVGCDLLGDVAIGIPPDAARPRTEEQLVILMRNKAAELGGNHVVVDSRSQSEGAGGETYWRGRGVAYACPEDAGGSPESGGGEAPPEEEPTPSDEGGESASEGDPIVDDLLGD